MSALDHEIPAFYAANPYPPPVDDLDGEADRWADGTRRRGAMTEVPRGDRIRELPEPERFAAMERPSTVVIVEERLPEGVAAALTNRAHTARDLVFFADADARCAFEQIDGATLFGEINGATADLLRRLWLHDLVMIDAGGASTSEGVLRQ